MLTNEELALVRGGGITATLLNSVSRLVDTIFNLGQTVGSTIRRLISNNVCKIS